MAQKVAPSGSGVTGTKAFSKQSSNGVPLLSDETEVFAYTQVTAQ